MSCEKCGQTKCCCSIKVISKIGEKGKQGGPGPKGSAIVGEASGQLSRAAATASGSQVITVGKKVKLVHITIGDTNFYSKGISDGTNQNCVSNATGAPDLSNCINVVSGGNGHTALISAIANTTFTLNWTKVGSGRDLIGHWHAITE